MEQENTVVNLLETKKRYLSRIIDLNKETKFIGRTEEDALSYISLIEKRENIFEEVKIIDFRLKMPEYQEVFQDADFVKKYDEIKNEMRQITTKIMEFDSGIKGKVDVLRLSLKEKIKSFSQGQNLNYHYNYNTSFDGMEHHSFDSRN